MASVALLSGAFALIAGVSLGDRGLGAFLKDGSGFQNSAYKEGGGERPAPPRWLDKVRLPTFDFVQVYNSDEEAALKEADMLRLQLQAALDEGQTDRAQQLERRLRQVCRDNGLFFEEDGASTDKEEL